MFYFSLIFFLTTGAAFPFGGSTAPSIFGGQVSSAPESLGQQSLNFNFAGPPVQAKAANGAGTTNILSTPKVEFNFSPPTTDANAASTPAETKNIFGAPAQSQVKFNFVGSPEPNQTASLPTTQVAASTPFNFGLGELRDL